MLKTAVITIGISALGTGAFAVEMPKYDRKIERAAIVQVARKMGALRQTLLHPAVIVDRSGVTPFDMQTTSGIFTQPNEPRFGTLQAPKYYFILAGSYNP